MLVLKTGVFVKIPGVRIPPCPFFFYFYVRYLVFINLLSLSRMAIQLMDQNYLLCIKSVLFYIIFQKKITNFGSGPFINVVQCCGFLFM